MLALPLGASEQDALIEEAVARQLYDAEIGKATLQKNLHDWWVHTFGLKMRDRPLLYTLLYVVYLHWINSDSIVKFFFPGYEY